MSAYSLLFEHEAAIRNAAFDGVIIVIALWEVLSPHWPIQYGFAG